MLNHVFLHLFFINDPHLCNIKNHTEMKMNGRMNGMTRNGQETKTFGNRALSAKDIDVFYETFDLSAFFEEGKNPFGKD